MNDRKQLSTLLTLLCLPLLVTLFLFFSQTHDWSYGKTAAITVAVTILLRAGLDYALRQVMPAQSLFAVEDPAIREADLIQKRRIWFWKFWGKTFFFYSLLSAWVAFKHHHPFLHEFTTLAPHIFSVFAHPAAMLQAAQVVGLFAVNFLIFMGPMIAMNVSQIKSFEPGDVNLGVKFEDVRGQKEAKEEIKRVVEVWESGDRFKELGGKPDRGMLLLGSPGVGKTMIAKAVATSFNAPFVFIPGSGFAAAQPLSSKVLTPNGWKKMGDVSIGDEVINPEGGTARVVGIFSQGERDVYEVTFGDNSKTRCDLEHLWKVRDRNGGRPWKVLALRDIQSRLSRLKRQSRPYIPMVQDVEFEDRSLPLDPYLLGALLGDGGLSHAHHVTFHNIDEEVIRLVEDRLPIDVHLRKDSNTCAWRIVQREHKSRGVGGGSGRASSSIKQALRDLNLCVTAQDKFVPDIFKFAPSDVRLEVLRGLMDTDGHARKRGNELNFTTTSLRLAEDVQFLVQSFGGTCNICRSEPGTYRHPDGSDRPALPTYTMSPALPPEINPFRMHRKAELFTQVRKPCRRMKSVERVGRELVQCIKLDSENELYVTDNFIVTHNTFIGVDAIVVRFMYRKAKKLARKWGGTCIVFIDEIDAVGRRRNNMMGGQVGGMGGMFGGGMGQMALNQLLVVMDSIESPPWFRQFMTRKLNTTLDAIYFVPRRVGKVSLRLPTAKPRKDQNVFFLGATNIDLEALDEALVRAGRMGRHIYFRTPTKADRKDVLDLYMSKVSHEAELDTDTRRDELARITEGVSPATIEQICSMALINAQNDNRDEFNFKDFLEAMTTLQAGTAVGVEYTADESLAVALHEAGHAAASHIYCPYIESSRLSIKMRGNSLGHHMALDKEERFGRWRSEDFGELVRGVAAMAAEYVFYGENGQGVSGDLGQVSARSRMMTSRFGMTPYFTEIPQFEILPFPGQEPVKAVRSEAEKVLAQFEFVGRRLLVPDGTDGEEKDKLAAQFVGHAFVTAWNFIRLNKEQIQTIADAVNADKEIFGNDIIKLLDDQRLEKFDHLNLDNFLDIENWPVL